MNIAYLALGSNRGNREENLRTAIKLIEEKAGKVLLASSIYETQPWQMDDDTSFFNQVIQIETPLPAIALMKTLISIEEFMGRIRQKRAGYESRIIDIDILFFNNDIIQTESLVVPHPHISDRKFVLEPLAEIAPTYIHPSLQSAIKQLLKDCKDMCLVTKIVLK
jgi:2-amino-4-hydroxy-6-hydroxymethyldihydropteridine diphosphokinase